MDPFIIGILGLFMLIVFLAIGLPIGISMGLVGFLGLFIMRGDAAFATLYTIPYSSMASWSLSVVPMFLLMGYIAFYAGFTKDAYEAAYRWVGRLPGGVAIATLFGAAAFGACCGSSVAATAALGKIALPEMRKFNYSTRLASGVVAMGGTLAALIPPSILLVLYGIVTEQSVGKLLIAGIFPGLLSMTLFSLLVLARAVINPKLAPRGESSTIKERLLSLKNAIGILLIFLFVIGGIYTGIFTPTEAGALGAFITLLLSLVMGRMRWGNFKEAVMESLRVTSSVFLIVLGAYIFIQFLAVSRMPIELSEWVASLPINRYLILIGIIIVYLFLGCFLDAIGLLLLTVPFIFPAIKALGFDPIWFGVLVVKLIEIGLLTPPVGIQTYVLKGVAPDIRLEDIFLGFLPFFMVDLFLVIGLLIIFPEIATFLPSMMR